MGIVGAKNNMQRDRDAALLVLIDKSMKKHADNLMNALEGINARLIRLEDKSRQLENSVDDLKEALMNNQESTDGKFRHIHIAIKEVHAGVDVVKDKHELLEAHLRLSRLQLSNVGQQLESPNFGHMNTMPQGTTSTTSATSYGSGHLFHELNPFAENVTPISQHGSCYQPSSQQFQQPPPSPHQQPLPLQYQQSHPVPLAQPPQFTFEPDAPPYAQSLDLIPSSSNSRKKDPMDDLVDKVNSMGFPKDLVRSTIKKLKDDRQEIDLNVVLDKLMTN
ncbi:uncharacterized protein [Rutidosis leptorrhynchoides]|uniref:uncharacterized protein n=1 Tax=Rutidosis leptorrhynchoides TaxID=125765 RepID=UPI003A99A54B